MNYKEFTNKQLANELQYMPYLADLSPSEFDLIETIRKRLLVSVIQMPPLPKKKSKCKSKKKTGKN